jgi:MFS family permease
MSSTHSTAHQELVNHDTEDYPDSAYAWYVTILLFVTSVFSFVDRMVLALLIEPVKADLSLTDTQISVLHGFAFAIFYAVMGLPLGRLADSKNRRNIITVGMSCWCAMTAACGMAKNFSGLFIARIGVGVGEAAFGPAAYSMVSDYFPKDKRSKPISVLAMGPYVGGGLAFLAGGYIIGLIPPDLEIMLPLLGIVKPWQITFIAVGLPGLLIAALIFLTISEPLRRDRIGRLDEQLPFSETLKFMGKHWRVYTLLTLGYSCTAMTGYATQAWIPSLFIRNYGWTAQEIGYAAGFVVLIAGGGGTLLGGVIADCLVKKKMSDAYLRVSAWFSFAPFLIIGAVLVPIDWMTILILVPTLLFLGIHIGVGMAAVTQVTPNEFRGQVIAVYLFFLVLLGAGLGPFTVAIFTDFVFQNEFALHKSLALFGGIMGGLASLFFWLGLTPYGKMMKSVGH